VTFVVRAMAEKDVASCVSILNHIIALGGSTAHEEPLSLAELRAKYLDDPPISNVVEMEGRIVGFQAAFDVGGGEYSIASFTDRRIPIKGAGRALFEKTLADCRAQGGIAILAKITSDNSGGLRFYSRLGFQECCVIPNDHRRKDGAMVDRVVKRFSLV